MAPMMTKKHYTRLSSRQAAKDEEEVEVPKRETIPMPLADNEIPEFLGSSPSDDYEDREELLFDPEEAMRLDNGTVVSYLAAADIKSGVGNHDAFVHLAQCQYDVRSAMESIDDADGMPLATLHGPNGMGVWTSDELKVFANMLEKRDRPSIPDKIPTKTRANIKNAYYKLKVNRCAAKTGYFCMARVNSSRQFPQNKDCENCRDELWKSGPMKLPQFDKLCALCTVYFCKFGAMRPNAAVTPEVFNFDLAKKCRCQITTENCCAKLKQCVNKDVITINSADIASFLQMIDGSTQSRFVANMAGRMRNLMKSDHSYVFVCRRGVKELDNCKRLELGESTEDDKENAPELYCGLTKDQHLKVLWSTNAPNGNRLTVDEIHKFMTDKCNTDVPVSILNEYEAGLLTSEPDVMYFGTRDADGRLKQAKDDAFDKYLRRLQALQKKHQRKLAKPPPSVPVGSSRKRAAAASPSTCVKRRRT